MPLSKLNLKVGCPIILLRNIAPGQDHIIEARILCGNHAGKLTFIPRITLNPSTSEFPFVFKRRQFPIRVAFGMAINKSQGQSIKYVGLDLRTPVFFHGQLYVALSRSTFPRSIKVLFFENNIDTTTTNMVYPEALIPETHVLIRLRFLAISNESTEIEKNRKKIIKATLPIPWKDKSNNN
ncbi:2582_t:CDS:2 [Gigaspora margarita]|uniref:2582_t:CDS:1 n=1 Tax=Gigaspora margarita TaxID=4874 RepID=A0ABM8W1U7_GIGMA|nr:2582_t:CDS:2 [Gigaspora margarita]